MADERTFSRQTYNGYHLVSLKHGRDPIGFFKKSSERDEFGFKVVEDPKDRPQCPRPGRHGPWGSWLYTPSACQKCPWIYRDPQTSDYDCLLGTKKKINPACLVNQKQEVRDGS